MNIREFPSLNEAYSAFNPETEEDAVILANQALRLLNDPVSQRLFALMQFNLHLAFEKTDPDDFDRLSEINRTLQTLAAFKQHFEILGQAKTLNEFREAQEGLLETS